MNFFFIGRDSRPSIRTSVASNALDLDLKGEISDKTVTTASEASAYNHFVPHISLLYILSAFRT